MSISDLPTLNAILNGTATVLLLCGLVAVRRGQIGVHRAFMLAAFGTSALFLISYLIYHYNSIHTVFSGPDWVRWPYYAMLVSHIILAVALLPLVLITLRLAWLERWPSHRRIARWTLPIWLYVSVTGVVVYLVLYVVFPAA